MAYYTDTNEIDQEYSKNIINKMISLPTHIPYFVTSVFKFQKSSFESFGSLSEHQVNRIWRNYEFLYNRICYDITKGIPKKTKKAHYPFKFDFIDFGGTRIRSKTALNDPHTPHIHSIYLIHPATNDRFLNLVTEGFKGMVRDKSMSPLISIDTQPIAQKQDDISRVISYSAKLHSSYQGKTLHRTAGLINQYPKARSAETSRKNPRQAAMEKMRELQADIQPKCRS